MAAVPDAKRRSGLKRRFGNGMGRRGLRRRRYEHPWRRCVNLRRHRWLRRRGRIESSSNSSPSSNSSYFLDFLVFLAFLELADFELLVVNLGVLALAEELFRIRQRQAVVIVEFLFLYFFLFFVPSLGLREVAEGKIVVLNLFFLELFVLAHGLLIRDRFLTRDDRLLCARVTVFDRLVVFRLMVSRGGVLFHTFVDASRFVAADRFMLHRQFQAGDRFHRHDRLVVNNRFTSDRFMSDRFMKSGRFVMNERFVGCHGS